MQTTTTALLQKPLSSNSEKTIRFLSILSIYLAIIVCIQFVFILILNDNHQRQAVNDYRNSEENSDCESSHSITKRQVGRGWQGQVFCPPGCVRRRKKKGKFAHTRSESTIGNYGESGSVGYPGERGPPGESGYPGERGLAGPPGENGYPGERGQAGPPGESGYPGERGLAGPPGESGYPGERGQAGPPGESGYPGERGLAGPPGESGYPGQHGSIGMPGPAGHPGSRGAQGPTGYGYNYERRSGFTRGDQREQKENFPPQLPASKSSASELLKEFRLYSHPECKDEVNHRALMDTLKDQGKVSFMIMIDLRDNEYCIVHA